MLSFFLLCMNGLMTPLKNFLPFKHKNRFNSEHAFLPYLFNFPSAYKVFHFNTNLPNRYYLILDSINIQFHINFLYFL